MQEDIHEVAKGCIWSGEQARARQHVDTTGNFADAVAIAKKAGGIDADKPVQLKPFPRPRSVLQRLGAGEPFSGPESQSMNTAAIEAKKAILADEIG